MKLRATIGVGVGVGLVLIGLCAAGAADDVRTIVVEGRQARVRVVGERLHPKQPIVVFESGMATGLDAWSATIDRVKAFAPIVAYDRPGVGGSDALTDPPTPRNVARNLHAVLAQLKLPPPYVLVGHSWGGPLIRMYIGLYPTDVAGLVYLDPTDLRTQAQDDAHARSLGYDAAGWAARKQQSRRDVERFGGAFQREMRVAFALEDDYYAEFRPLPHPDVPVTVLVGAKFSATSWQNAPCEPRVCHERWVATRAAVLSGLLQPSTAGVMVVTTKAGHEIHRDEPALAVRAIEDVVRAASQ